MRFQKLKEIALAGICLIWGLWIVSWFPQESALKPVETQTAAHSVQALSDEEIGQTLANVPSLVSDAPQKV